MINIDSRDRKPIYEQLVENIKKLVLDKTLSPDEQLPSVRQLSMQLAINPNTIQKAYSQLEREGVIYTVSGKGNFISPDTDGITEAHNIQVMEELVKVLTSARSSGIEKARITGTVDKIYGEVNTNDKA
ncbi:MAG: GntR family transcriptional regulator [Eubacteriales bacterium]